MKLHVTANTLASFITAKSPERKQTVVRAAQRALKNDKGYAPYYRSLYTPARLFMKSSGGNSAALLALIEKMKKRGGKKWHLTDARITTEAAQALLKLAPQIEKLDMVFLMPPKGIKAKIEFPDIDLFVPPDMLVQKRRNTATSIGALRFYTAKESAYELGQKGAELVAAMQHLWLLRVATGPEMPDPSLCMVIECQQQRITHASTDTEQANKLIEQGCQDFARLWHRLDSKDAA